MATKKKTPQQKEKSHSHWLSLNKSWMEKDNAAIFASGIMVGACTVLIAVFVVIGLGFIF